MLENNYEKSKIFPKDFFWGAATASYQVEGGIENNDWAEASREGRVPECGLACDHYHRYKEDFATAKMLGHTAHRLSVEWSRIEPEEGKFNAEAIAHYRDVLKALHQNNLKPFVTIWHFTLPLWFSKTGGFERTDSPEIFARYCTYVVKELGDLCDHFSTMNEPNVFASQGWINGEWPPFRYSRKPWLRVNNLPKTRRKKILFGLQYLRVMKNLSRCHIEAYLAIKRINPNASVSVVKHIHVYLPTHGLINKVKTWFSDYVQNHRFLNRIKNYLDEIGINYYQASQYGVELTDRKTDMGWNYLPEKIYEAIMLVAKYQKPMFISEAGLADATDSGRAEYITKQVEGVWRAIEAGADVRGHLYWSLLDNYEWALGFEKRFGLVEINYQTQERKIRPSAYVYKKICEDNGIVE